MYALSLFIFVALCIAVSARPSYYGCTNPTNWAGGNSFGNMGISSFSSASSGQCTITGLPSQYVANTQYSFTVDSSGSYAHLTYGSAGAMGGESGSQDTCHYKNSPSMESSYTWTAPSTGSGSITFSALCGSQNQGVMYASSWVTLSESVPSPSPSPAASTTPSPSAAASTTPSPAASTTPSPATAASTTPSAAASTTPSPAASTTPSPAPEDAEITSPGNVTVSFMGESGGMKLMHDEGDFILIKQHKLEEEDDDGSPTNNKLNMAGGDFEWGPVTEVMQDGYHLYTTQFTKTSGDVKFALTAHYSVGTAKAKEFIPCVGCTNDILGANCQNEMDGECAQLEENDECPFNTTSCHTWVDVLDKEVKFSFQLTGWEFLNTENTLHYAIEVSQTGGAPIPEMRNSGDNKIIKMGRGYIQMPTYGFVYNEFNATKVDVTVTGEEQASKYIMHFYFNSHMSTDTLYYDPTMSLEEANNDDDPQLSPASRASVTTSMVLVVLSAFFLQLFM